MHLTSQNLKSIVGALVFIAAGTHAIWKRKWLLGVHLDLLKRQGYPESETQSDWLFSISTIVGGILFILAGVFILSECVMHLIAH